MLVWSADFSELLRSVGWHPKNFRSWGDQFQDITRSAVVEGMLDESFDPGDSIGGFPGFEIGLGGRRCWDKGNVFHAPDENRRWDDGQLINSIIHEMKIDDFSLTSHIIASSPHSI